MRAFSFLVVLMWACSRAYADDNSAGNWPAWRGAQGTGVASSGNPPVTWSETENIRWKTKLPGLGHSTPIVWGDRIFLITAIPFGPVLNPPQPDTAPGAHDNLLVKQKRRFEVLAVDRRSGEIVWRRPVHEALPHEGGHYTASLASGSPVTDGQHVYCYFGSYGLYALDFDGQIVWEKSLGKLNTKHGHGEGASPVLHGDTLAVNVDQEGKSFVVALNKTNGAEIWRNEREEVTSWATPIVVEQDGRQQLIVSGTSRVRGYDLATGKVIWECGGLSKNIVASPVAADGMVFVGSSYDTRAMLAIRLAGATGDITDTDRVVWSRTQRTPYVPSPLLYDGSLYFLRHYQGILSRLDAKTGGEPTGPFRLNGIRNVYASPIAVADRIYVTDLDGVTLVLAHDEIPRLLAVNRLDDEFSASLAVAGNELFLRGREYLYCVAR